MSTGFSNGRYRCYVVEDVYWLEDTEDEHTVIAIEREQLLAVAEMLLRMYNESEDSERIRVAATDGELERSGQG